MMIKNLKIAAKKILHLFIFIYIIIIYVFKEMSSRTMRAMCNDTGTWINYVAMARVNGNTVT